MPDGKTKWNTCEKHPKILFTDSVKEAHGGCPECFRESGKRFVVAGGRTCQTTAQ